MASWRRVRRDRRTSWKSAAEIRFRATRKACSWLNGARLKRMNRYSSLSSVLCFVARMGLKFNPNQFYVKRRVWKSSFKINAYEECLGR